jgi:hypothetical protein
MRNRFAFKKNFVSLPLIPKLQCTDQLFFRAFKISHATKELSILFVKI